MRLLKFSIIAFTLLLMSSVTHAQDVDVLLETVDKIEVNLDKMLKQEATTGDQQQVNQKSQIVDKFNS